MMMMRGGGGFPASLTAAQYRVFAYGLPRAEELRSGAAVAAAAAGESTDRVAYTATSSVAKRSTAAKGSKCTRAAAAAAAAAAAESSSRHLRFRRDPHATRGDDVDTLGMSSALRRHDGRRSRGRGGG